MASSLIDPVGNYETIVEERVDETGKRYKVTRKILKKLVEHRVPKAIAARRQWKKFGDAVDHGPGPNTKTTLIGEEVYLRFGRNRSFDTEETSHGGEAGKDSLVATGSGRITCRLCQGAHFTAKCPFKDYLPEAKSGSAAKCNKSNFGIYLSFLATIPTADGTPQISTSSKYVPPSQRGKTAVKPGEYTETRDDSTTVRVTNLSIHSDDAAVRMLFSYVGNVTRFFLPKELDGKSKGYAFVTYLTKEEAAQAIERLNKHAFDNLILKVEWASREKPQ